jgi:Arc/MetJ-type ribon-helix-helix transcriptional regulator
MVQKTVRLPRFLVDRLAKEMRPRGYTSLSAFIRIALQNELDGRESEQRIASTIDRFARELRRLDTTHQAEFALLDALARVILHCLPEPQPEIRDQATAKAKERHQKLLKMAALNMQGDARAALLELVQGGN